MSEFKRAKMTGWYDPVQLGRTAVEVFISTIFGRHADRRLLEPLAPPGTAIPDPFHDFSTMTGDEFWFDYVSDVGDGFNATYTMAYHLTEPILELGGEQTKPGQILVFGGDEVYPIAHKDFYKHKLEGPYGAAKPDKTADDEGAPTVFAVPGNHDWYDSLVQFSRIFIDSSTFCGWKAGQDRSYFAIKLPAGWWLFGTDMQLGSSLDTPQLDYFKRAMTHVQDGERIILCNAEPHWITAAMYPDDPNYNNRNMGYFEGGVLKRKVAVYVAGDRHYYRRHEEVSNGKTIIPADSPSKVQKIAAGGGGAFLHPTHKENIGKIGRRHLFDLRKSYPEPDESATLNWWNLAFLLKNWRFGILTGILYVLTARAFLSDLGKYDWKDFFMAFRTVFHDALTEPFALFWVIAFLGGFILFTDTSSKRYKWIAGPIHGLAHLGGIFLVGWRVSYYWAPGVGLNYNSIRELLIAAVLIFIGGFIIGPVIMGIYLLISLNVFGRHHNEAFSALKIEDYKNFVRFKIEKNGDLVIYPVGVKKAIKKWKDGDNNGRKIVPAAMSEDNKAKLIEPAIRFVKPL